MYDPLKVEKADHPDLVGGIVWSNCELVWIRDYGKRCYNHGIAKGMAARQPLPRNQPGATCKTCEALCRTVMMDQTGAA